MIYLYTLPNLVIHHKDIIIRTEFGELLNDLTESKVIGVLPKPSNFVNSTNLYLFEKWIKLKDCLYKNSHPNLLVVSDVLKDDETDQFCGIDLKPQLNKIFHIKCEIPDQIKSYIDLYSKKVAIVVCINELIGQAKGTGKNGIKKTLSYVEQFLMLYYSIKDNWKFDYDIYVFHSRPFSSRVNKLLSGLEVQCIFIDTKNLLIRPESYKVNLPCDYRLVLDCDMIAVKTPNFNFRYDAYGTYGNFNPDYDGRLKDRLNAINIPFKESYKFQRTNQIWDNTNLPHLKRFYNRELTHKLQPIFNHGAILISNKYADSLGTLLMEYKKILKTTNGQTIVGFIIDYLTQGNWMHFNPGINLYVNQLNATWPLVKDYINYTDKIYLIHYIFTKSDNLVYKRFIKKYYDYVKSFNL